MWAVATQSSAWPVMTYLRIQLRGCPEPRLHPDPGWPSDTHPHDFGVGTAEQGSAPRAVVDVVRQGPVAVQQRRLELLRRLQRSDCFARGKGQQTSAGATDTTVPPDAGPGTGRQPPQQGQQCKRSTEADLKSSPSCPSALLHDH
eukprot:357650-Chlamydomonas_euryale.AAC.3